MPAIRMQISCNDQISLAARDEVNTAGTIRTTNVLSVHMLVGSDVLRMPETSLPT